MSMKILTIYTGVLKWEEGYLPSRLEVPFTTYVKLTFMCSQLQEMIIHKFK